MDVNIVPLSSKFTTHCSQCVNYQFQLLHQFMPMSEAVHVPDTGEKRYRVQTLEHAERETEGDHRVNVQ